MATINLRLGIIEGDKKRALENYIDPRHFTQRKSYDEYYIDIDTIEADWSIQDLMIIADHFTVSIEPDCVSIECD